jgi:hypothetical protein
MVWWRWNHLGQDHLVAVGPSWARGPCGGGTVFTKTVLWRWDRLGQDGLVKVENVNTGSSNKSCPRWSDCHRTVLSKTVPLQQDCLQDSLVEVSLSWLRQCVLWQLDGLVQWQDGLLEVGLSSSWPKWSFCCLTVLGNQSFRCRTISVKIVLLEYTVLSKTVSYQLDHLLGQDTSLEAMQRSSARQSCRCSRTKLSNTILWQWDRLVQDSLWVVILSWSRQSCGSGTVSSVAQKSLVAVRPSSCSSIDSHSQYSTTDAYQFFS